MKMISENVSLVYKGIAISILLLVLMFSGCTSAHTGEVVNAQLSPDGSYIAVVHRLGNSLILSISNTTTSDLKQFEVAGSALSWSKSNLLACEIINKHKKCVAVFAVPLLSEPQYCETRISSKPTFVNDKLYYLTFEETYKLFSVGEGSWTESQLHYSAQTDIVDYRILSNNELLVLTRVPGSEECVDATTDLLSDIGIATPEEILPRKPLQTRETFCAAPFDVELSYVDRVAESPCVSIATKISYDNEFIFSANKSSEEVILGDKSKLFRFSLRIKRKEDAPKIKTDQDECPLASPRGVFCTDSGTYVLCANGVYLWEKRDASLIESGYPFPLGRMFQVHERGFLVSLEPNSLPARYVALLSEGKFNFFPLTAFYAKELRSFVASKRDFSNFSRISISGLPESTSFFQDCEPQTFTSEREFIPVAEIEIIRGDVDKALKIYESSEEKNALRLAEIYLFHKYDLENSKKWLAHVSESEFRKRVDLYIKILYAKDKLKEEYMNAQRALDLSNWAAFEKSVSYYIKKCDISELDPDIYARAIDYYQYHSDNEKVLELVSALEELDKDHSFYNDTRNWLKNYYASCGNTERSMQYALKMAQSYPQKKQEYLWEVINSSFEPNADIESARQAIDSVLKFRLSYDEVVSLRLRKMALFSLYKQDILKTLEQSNTLSWGAFETTPQALEAGYYSIVLSDLLSHEDVNLITQRFSKNPRITVRNTVPDLLLISLQSGIMHLTQEEIAGGIETLPQWFVDRIQNLKDICSMQEVVPYQLFDILMAKDCTTEDLNVLRLNAQNSKLARCIYQLKLVLDSLSAVVAPAHCEIDLPLPFMPPIELQHVTFDLGSLRAISGNDPVFWLFILKKSADCRLFEGVKGFSILSHDEFSRRFAKVLSFSYGKISESRAEKLSALIQSLSFERLVTYIRNANDNTAASFLSILQQVCIFSGNTPILEQIAQTKVTSENTLLKTSALDSLCFLYKQTGEKEKLAQCVLKLSECTEREKFAFSSCPEYFLSLGNVRAENGKVKEAADLFLEYLIRGGLLEKSIEDIRSFNVMHPGIFENWAKDDPDSVAIFIYMGNSDNREELLEMCGKQKGNIGKKLAELDGVPAEENSSKPEQ